MDTAESRKRERLERFKRADLYPVTCEALSNGRTDLEVLDAVIRGGARLIQLRDKTSAKRGLYGKAAIFRQKTLDAGILLIINDHVDIALAVDADGVHLGQDDLPVPVARRLIPDKIIGVSIHNIWEARTAQREGADYVNIGPIFATGTKEGVGEFLGPQAIPGISLEISLPFTVMGGIKESNIRDVLENGARRIALVTAVTQADDMAAAVERLRKIINSFSPAPPRRSRCF